MIDIDAHWRVDGFSIQISPVDVLQASQVRHDCRPQSPMIRGGGVVTELGGWLDIFKGVDVGKGEHHAVAFNRAAKRLFDKALPNDETRLLHTLISAAARSMQHALRSPRVALLQDAATTCRLRALPRSTSDCLLGRQL